MQITRHTDYALRVLVFVGLRPGVSTTVREIASYFGISQHHLVKIVQRLADGGFVVAKRGRGGGVTLARDARTINLADVFRHTEHERGIVECLRDGAPPCRFQGPCALEGILVEALDRFLDELGRHSLADVLSPMSRLLAPDRLVRSAPARPSVRRPAVRARRARSRS